MYCKYFITPIHKNQNIKKCGIGTFIVTCYIILNLLFKKYWLLINSSIIGTCFCAGGSLYCWKKYHNKNSENIELDKNEDSTVIESTSDESSSEEDNNNYDFTYKNDETSDSDNEVCINIPCPAYISDVSVCNFCVPENNI